jgi:hypothetical protein
MDRTAHNNALEEAHSVSDFSDFDPTDDDTFNINQREADDYRHDFSDDDEEFDPPMSADLDTFDEDRGMQIIEAWTIEQVTGKLPLPTAKDLFIRLHDAIEEDWPL